MTWQYPTSTGSAAPIGPAGGDLAGTYPNPTVANVSILTTKGDLLSETANGVAGRLAIGTTGQVLAVVAGLAAWVASPQSVLTTTGDLLYASAANTLARLGVGTTGQGLVVVGGLPAWAASATSVLTATGDLLYASAANTLQRLAVGSTGQNLTVVGGLPAWAASATSVLTTTGDLLYASAANTLQRLAVGAAGRVLGISAGLPAWVVPPGAEIGYDQITANVNVVSTTEATGTTIIAGSSYTFDGAPVLAQFSTAFLNLPTTLAGFMIVSLFEGATQIGRLAFGTNLVATQQQALPTSAFLRFTPSAGAHTYSVTASVSGTTGTPAVIAGAGGTGTAVPAFLRLTKV